MSFNWVISLNNKNKKQNHHGSKKESQKNCPQGSKENKKVTGWHFCNGIKG
jgi:hypothetical protein